MVNNSDSLSIGLDCEDGELLESRQLTLDQQQADDLSHARMTPIPMIGGSGRSRDSTAASEMAPVDPAAVLFELPVVMPPNPSLTARERSQELDDVPLTPSALQVLYNEDGGRVFVVSEMREVNARNVGGLPIAAPASTVAPAPQERSDDASPGTTAARPSRMQGPGVVQGPESDADRPVHAMHHRFDLDDIGPGASMNSQNSSVAPANPDAGSNDTLNVDSATGPGAPLLDVRDCVCSNSSTETDTSRTSRRISADPVRGTSRVQRVFSGAALNFSRSTTVPDTTTSEPGRSVSVGNMSATEYDGHLRYQTLVRHAVGRLSMLSTHDSTQEFACRSQSSAGYENITDQSGTASTRPSIIRHALSRLNIFTIHNTGPSPTREGRQATAEPVAHENVLPEAHDGTGKRAVFKASLKKVSSVTRSLTKRVVSEVTTLDDTNTYARYLGHRVSGSNTEPVAPPLTHRRPSYNPISERHLFRRSLEPVGTGRIDGRPIKAPVTRTLCSYQDQLEATDTPVPVSAVPIAGDGATDTIPIDGVQRPLHRRPFATLRKFRKRKQAVLPV